MAAASILFEFGDHIDVVGHAVGGNVGDFQVSGVFQEIDAAHLDFCHIESGASLDVGHEKVVVLGFDKVDLLV